uniref:Ig-like domain-containing protein n=1 Tax=Sander lucioperca TaxID=283035 RepID=A0A8C9X4V7_SANLU
RERKPSFLYRIQRSISNKAVVSLQPNWPLIFSGETITVGCDISRVGYTEWHEYTEWEYEWSKPNSNTIPTNNGYIISSATVSNSGNYRCMGKPKRDLYSSTAWSNVITLIVSRKAVVILQPNWPEIYSGETITLRCEIQGRDTEWEYEWMTTSSYKPPNLNEYRIRSVSPSYRGDYWCKGRLKRAQQNSTEWSISFTLTASYNPPQPVLTVSPSWLSPGVSVTLNCSVKDPSAGWRFYWYKADSYIVDGQTHTAGYVCRAARGDPVFYTHYSEPKFVWSGGRFVSFFLASFLLSHEEMRQLQNGNNLATDSTL